MTMSKLAEELKNLLQELETERDEVRVRLHLAKAEINDAWNEFEPKWQHFKTKAVEVAGEADKTSDEVKAALALAGQELKAGYQRIRKVL